MIYLSYSGKIKNNLQCHCYIVPVKSLISKANVTIAVPWSHTLCTLCVLIDGAFCTSANIQAMSISLSSGDRCGQKAMQKFCILTELLHDFSESRRSAEEVFQIGFVTFFLPPFHSVIQSSCCLTLRKVCSERMLLNNQGTCQYLV